MNALTGLIIVVIALLLSLPVLKVAVDRLIKYQAQKTQIATTDPLLAGLQPGKPALIYFTGAHCGPCRLVQKPVIQQLMREHGDTLQMLEVDIEQQMDAALRWGVLKVPRTFILDRKLQVYTTNLDVALLSTLKQQLDEASQA